MSFLVDAEEMVIVVSQVAIKAKDEFHCIQIGTEEISWNFSYLNDRSNCLEKTGVYYKYLYNIY